MSNFLYFVANHEGPATDDLIGRVGLSYVFDSGADASSTHIKCDRLGHGSLLCDKTSNKPLKYDLSAQTWVEACPTWGVWVGLWNQDRPTPIDLERNSIVPGLPVMLGKQVWTMPLIRMADGSTMLPRHMAWDATHGWKPGSIVQKYAALRHSIGDVLYEKAIKALDDESELNWDDPCGDCVKLLAVNYKISNAEASLLDMFATCGEYTDAFLALLNAIDWERLCVAHELKKKGTS